MFPSFFPLGYTPLMNEAIKEFVKTYGPFAFGMVSLLILWIAILKPQLDRQTLDYETQRVIIEAQNKTLDAQKSLLRDQDGLSENMRQTSIILERIIREMDNKEMGGQ
jgi:hypothetical protein